MRFFRPFFLLFEGNHYKNRVFSFLEKKQETSQNAHFMHSVDFTDSFPLKCWFCWIKLDVMLPKRVLSADMLTMLNVFCPINPPFQDQGAPWPPKHSTYSIFSTFQQTEAPFGSLTSNMIQHIQQFSRNKHISFGNFSFHVASVLWMGDENLSIYIYIYIWANPRILDAFGSQKPFYPLCSALNWGNAKHAQVWKTATLTFLLKC